MRPQPSQAGFTLLEVMVAISIFAVLGIGAYRLLHGEIRTQERVLAHSQRLQQWQRGWHRLGQDILQLSPRPVRDNYGDIEPALSGTSDSLTLTRTGWPNPLARLRSHSQRVHYGLGQPDNNPIAPTDNHSSLALLRRYWRVLDRAPDSEPLQQVLLADVQSLNFRYLDAEGEWQSQWPPSASGSRRTADTELPAAIEVRLVSRAYGEISRLFAVGEIDGNQTP